MGVTGGEVGTGVPATVAEFDVTVVEHALSRADAQPSENARRDKREEGISGNSDDDFKGFLQRCGKFV